MNMLLFNIHFLDFILLLYYLYFLNWFPFFAATKKKDPLIKRQITFIFVFIFFSILLECLMFLLLMKKQTILSSLFKEYH